MAQSPKRPRRLPEDAAQRTDHEIIELLFGKETAAELEELAGVRDSSMKGS